MASIRSNEASMWKLEIKERLIDGNNGLKLQDACDKRAAGRQGGRAAADAKQQPGGLPPRPIAGQASVSGQLRPRTDVSAALSRVSSHSVTWLE